MSVNEPNMKDSVDWLKRESTRFCTCSVCLEICPGQQIMLIPRNRLSKSLLHSNWNWRKRRFVSFRIRRR